MLALERITPEDFARVQPLIDRLPDFLFNTEGVRHSPHYAAQTMRDLPHGCTAAQNHLLLVKDDVRDIGFIDFVADYPARGQASVGLFLIDEPYQKRGLGRQIYGLLESYVRQHLRASALRVGVNDSNPVQGFWEKMGFTPTGESKLYTGARRQSKIIVMEKYL